MTKETGASKLKTPVSKTRFSFGPDYTLVITPFCI